MNRPNWNTYFMDIALLIARRSTCIRRQVGAIMVKDNRILTTGYNGVPNKITHCKDVGCLRTDLHIPSGEKHELCRGVHAEQNAIIQAARFGISLEGATLYCTHFPCSICSKMLINCGIVQVYFHNNYDDSYSRSYLHEGNIMIRQF